MAEFELGVYANDFAPKPIRRKARDMIRLLPAGQSFYTVIPRHIENFSDAKRIIVVGGEGSIRRVVQMMHDREVVRPVGLLPGGSQNVLYKTLRKLGLQLDAKTFLEKTLHDYPEDRSLRPGMINDRIFVNHVGLGSLEQQLGRFNAILRFLPNGCRTFAAVPHSLVYAVLDTIISRRRFLNLYTISPRIGQILAFPDQELLSDTLTHVWVGGRRIRQLQRFCFKDRMAGNCIWIDGDTTPYSQQEVLITRASYGIPMVAIT